MPGGQTIYKQLVNHVSQWYAGYHIYQFFSLIFIHPTQITREAEDFLLRPVPKLKIDQLFSLHKIQFSRQ